MSMHIFILENLCSLSWSRQRKLKAFCKKRKELLTQDPIDNHSEAQFISEDNKCSSLIAPTKFSSQGIHSVERALYLDLDLVCISGSCFGYRCNLEFPEVGIYESE